MASTNSQFETRPGYLEDWLDTLPYADFKESSQLMLDALKFTNQQKLKPNTRLELISLYFRPYEFLLETKVQQNSQSGLHNLNKHISQIERIKDIAGEMAYGCRLAINESLTKKTRWLHSKPPVNGIFMAIRLLSQVLIMSYQLYAPLPKRIWHELNDLYASAERLAILQESTRYPGKDEDLECTILNAYKQIAATSLVDPHHLPESSIWEIFEQAGQWANDIEIVKYHNTESPAGFFVLQLQEDKAPFNKVRFQEETIDDSLRLLDCRELARHIQKFSESLRLGQPIGDELCFSHKHAAILLQHLNKAWGLPPQRYLPRQSRKGEVQITSGINSAFHHINGDVRDKVTNSEPDMDSIDLNEASQFASNRKQDFTADNWEFINAGPGGFSVYKGDTPNNVIRVGDLVAMLLDDNLSYWQLGVVRWLMVQKSREHKIGIQFISKSAKAVSVKAVGSNSMQKAFFLEMPGSAQGHALLMDKGFYFQGRDLEILGLENPRQVHANKLLESTVAFEQFSIH